MGFRNRSVLSGVLFFPEDGKVRENIGEILVYDLTERETGDFGGRAVEGLDLPILIDGQDACVHRLDDAPVQKIELIEVALLPCQKGSGLLLLFYDEACEKGNKIEGKDVGGNPGDKIAGVQKLVIYGNRMEGINHPVELQVCKKTI